MITRTPKICDLNEVFFPVEEQPISWGEFMGTGIRIPGYKAIVEKKHKKNIISSFQQVSFGSQP